MKKLFPLLVIAAGAVAYSVYKSHKEAEKSEENKTFVSLDDDFSCEENQNESEETIVESVEHSDPVEEAVQEVQEELGVFETLRDADEPYERPSFFHMTEDSYLEPESVEEKEEYPQVEEASEIITILVEDEEESEYSDQDTELADEESFEETDDEQIQEISEADESDQLDSESKESEAEDVLEVFEEPVEVTVADEVSEDVSAPAEEEPADETPEIEEEIVEAVEELNEFEEVLETFEEANQEVHDEFETSEDEVDMLIEEIAGQIEEASNPVEIEQEENEEAELEPLQSYNTPEVDALMKEIAGQVKAVDKTVTETPSEEPEITEEAQLEPQEETDYLQDIRKITELYSEKVAQYNIRYPYLSSRFIDDTLKFSHQFNTEYPMGTRVVIEHHAHFTAIEDLFVFAQFIRQSGYSVKEGTEDKSLVVVREMFVDNNTILHDVFKVANQVYCLSGEYQKFRISKR